MADYSQLNFWYGNDTYTINTTLRGIKKQFLKNNPGGDINVFDFAYSENKRDLLSLMLDSFRNTSLFSVQKMIIIKNFFATNKVKKTNTLKDTKNNHSINEEQLLRYLEQEVGYLIFIVEDKMLDKRSLAWKFIEKKKQAKLLSIQVFDVPLKYDFNKWLAKTIQERGGRIGKDDVDFLASILGSGMEYKEKGSTVMTYNLFQASMEVDKLLTYSYGRAITKNDILLLISASNDMNIFNLISSIGSKNKAKALQILSQQLSYGFNENYILTMLIYHFRTLLLVKSLRTQNKTEHEIINILKMNPYVVQKYIKFGNNLTLSYLHTIYQKLYNADVNIKSGKMSPELVLNLLIIAI